MSDRSRRPGSPPTPALAPQRFYIETWGCQMNELDSQRLAGQLLREGLLPAARPADADVVLLNSCSVREKAEQKAYSRLGEYRLLKRQRPDLVLGFCGCVAQQEGEAALRRVPELDFVLGTGRVGELRHSIAAARDGSRTTAIGFPEDRPYDLDAISRDRSHKGMVTVIEGCDQRCTFCIVPQTRGRERNRPLEAIVAEVGSLVETGFVEIELLGQTVNHWRGLGPAGEPYDFADLLDVVASLPGVRRLRFVTSYPQHFDQRMVSRVGAHPNICPYLHLPVQSGSDSVLRRMGRGYTAADYRRLAHSLRAARPGLALSTDVIVGFPGESDDDFVATLSLIEELRFACVFAFKYSPRPGTAALRLDGDVDDATADRRLQALLRLQARIQLELNRELEGRRLEVLVTGHGREGGSRVGRTACHRLVHFAVPAPLAGKIEAGCLVEVRIDRGLPHCLVATLLEAPPLHAARESADAAARSPRVIRSLPVVGLEVARYHDLDQPPQPIAGRIT
ncbi:MAG TPA: tRNA (N6-isopentenyl adenosine(37)-C2)-methylthiotransferase MiaB [Thermoanaerobaculia bacterium]|nr:tRNA (N6-isopentenyl adenosine(37)-C2)-methylthiotransferase MiaB [Thermoanaerobaculia bacterium]